MSTVTKELAKYLDKRGITIAAVIKGTGLSREAMYRSLGKNSTRELRIDEFFEICAFTQIDPMKFCPPKRVNNRQT